MPTPNPNQFNNLTGVAAVDPNDAWAVGLTDGNIRSNFALHWNGSVWSTVPTLQPSATSQQFNGVSAVGSNDVWAVGFYESGGFVAQNEAEHWDGIKWTNVPVPNVGTGSNILQSVFARASNDVWAVGYSSAPSTLSTLIEHWNGSVWSVQPSPSPGFNGVLYSVTATSSTDAWAVGNYESGGGFASLAEHLVSGVWTVASTPNPGIDTILYGVAAASSTNVWAVGYDTTPVAEHWDGTSWTLQSAGSGSNPLYGVAAALSGDEVWAVGVGTAGGFSGSALIEQFQLPAPTSLSATPGDQSATVSWSPPSCDGGFTTTGYLLTASDGCTILGTMSSATSPAAFTGLTNGSPVSFTVQAVSAALGAETPSALSAPVTPGGPTAPTAESACTAHQRSLHAPSGTAFTDMDSTNLALMVMPAASSQAVISANADLWTANLGVNQDIGIFVSGGIYGPGQIVAWKESGGSAGAYSPNAAAVQAVIPMAAGTTYVVKLQWKANKSAPIATIYAGAGPLEGDYRFSGSAGFSPTRLSLHLVPLASSPLTSVSTNLQYPLAGSNGASFVDMDSSGLSTTVNPVSTSTAVITGNADLWTANSGYNQDIGINVDGAVVAWKESGGSAGTFSPNAAFVEAVVPLAAGSHTVKLQWKTNRAEGTAKIYAGAGPWPSGGNFSPTRLTVWLLPAASVSPATSTKQYPLSNNDGAGWMAMDSPNLQLNVAPGATTSYLVTGNADLWTQTSGINQDLGIFISGGIYGNGALVAWKESGGLAGTFSPNAAFVEAVAHLPAGSYLVWLGFKANRPAAGTIEAGAGPWPPATTTYSPTVLTAAKLSSP